MAQRRMFSKEITNSSDFQMMSPSAQALYLHIGMNADDDGFCEAFTIVRMTESKPDDLRALQERGFIYLVDSRVCIVTDWHTNNDIRSDRYTRSRYLSDPKYADVYRAIMQDKVQHLSRYQCNLDGSTSGSTSGMTQVRLDKVRLGKKPSTSPQVTEDGYDQHFLSFWNVYPRKVGKGDAHRAWKKLKPSKALSERIVASVKEHQQDEQWRRESGRFIPNPSTFLNQRRFEDELKPQHPSDTRPVTKAPAQRRLTLEEQRKREETVSRVRQGLLDKRVIR